jgi:hypothetical protein
MKAYRKDNDLLFLQLYDNSDLEILVKFLTQDKKGNFLITEELTANDRFKNCAGNYKKVYKPRNIWNLCIIIQS